MREKIKQILAGKVDFAELGHSEEETIDEIVATCKKTFLDMIGEDELPEKQSFPKYAEKEQIHLMGRNQLRSQLREEVEKI